MCKKIELDEKNEYRISKILQGKIVYALKIVKKIFDENDVHYWLEGGTLIAAMRDTYILPWDNDGDISIDIKDIKYVHSLKKEFEKYGLSLHGFLSYKVMYDKTHLVCIMPSHIVKKYYVKTHNYFAILYNFLDLHGFPVEKIPTHPLLSLFGIFKEYAFIRGKKEWVQPFAYVEFCEEMYPIPCEPDKYLTFRFGDWRTEDKYISDTKIGNRYHKRWRDIL